MIRVQLNKTQLRVYSHHERITPSKAKRLLRLGNRMLKQQSVDALIIEVNKTVVIEKTALNIIQKSFNEISNLPIVLMHN